MKQACSHLAREKQRFSSKPRPNPNTMCSLPLLWGAERSIYRLLGPLFNVCQSPFGKEERMSWRGRALDPGCNVSSAFGESLSGWAWPCDSRASQHLQPVTLGHIYRYAQVFIFPHPSAVPGSKLAPSETPPLVSENPPKRCLLCACTQFCHLYSLPCSFSSAPEPIVHTGYCGWG